jgi:hypothetical protein
VTGNGTSRSDLGEKRTRTVGTAGIYDDVDLLLGAAEKVRAAGYRKWDCHTPYPVHGLDEAMGLRESPVPMVTLSAGLLGFLGAIVLTGGISVFQYPMNSGGKPLFAWPAFVPIMFELFVLFAALGTLGALIGLGRLGRWHSPLHDSDIMKEITANRFCIVLGADDERYGKEEAETLLRETGCTDIRPLVEVEDDEEGFL